MVNTDLLRRVSLSDTIAGSEPGQQITLGKLTEELKKVPLRERSRVRALYQMLPWLYQMLPWNGVSCWGEFHNMVVTDLGSSIKARTVIVHVPSMMWCAFDGDPQYASELLQDEENREEWIRYLFEVQ